MPSKSQSKKMVLRSFILAGLIDTDFAEDCAEVVSFVLDAYPSHVLRVLRGTTIEIRNAYSFCVNIEPTVHESTLD